MLSFFLWIIFLTCIFVLVGTLYKIADEENLLKVDEYKGAFWFYFLLALIVSIINYFI